MYLHAAKLVICTGDIYMGIRLSICRLVCNESRHYYLKSSTRALAGSYGGNNISGYKGIHIYIYIYNVVLCSWTHIYIYILYGVFILYMAYESTCIYIAEQYTYYVYIGMLDLSICWSLKGYDQ